jgi:hypothetical protein
MKSKLDPLMEKVVKLLKEAGFPEDQYIVKLGEDYVCVMFDQKEAVDYFRGDFENSEIDEDCVFYYLQDGKRHCAKIYPCY